MDPNKREFLKFLQKKGRLDKQFVPTIDEKQKRNTYWWCLCDFLGISHMWETLQLITNQTKDTLRRAYNYYKESHPGYINMQDWIKQDYQDFLNLQ